MKATHISLRSGRLYFDVGTEADVSGFVHAKLILIDSAWQHECINPEVLEPIPAPAPRRPFDYESWRALLKQHRGNVLVRHRDKGKEGSHFAGHEFLDVIKKNPATTLELIYSTDFGDTWQEMSRE